MSGTFDWLGVGLGLDMTTVTTTAASAGADTASRQRASLSWPIPISPILGGNHAFAARDFLPNGMLGGGEPQSDTDMSDAFLLDAHADWYARKMALERRLTPIVGCMVNRARFQAEAAAFSPPINIQALSYAVAALGALTSTECVSARDKCYNQARELLDLCERQDSDGMLVSINTLQTCVLLALYEFKSPNFARLWMTLGRAISLCKMMGLDMLDADRSGNSAGLFKQPPPSPDMPLLHHIEDLAPAVTLPPLAGTVFTGYLYRRLLEHVHLSQQQRTSPSYPFWVTHYSLDRLLLDCRARTSREQPTANDRVISLTMQSNLAAVEMLLHGTALSKAETESHLPAVLRTDAATRCAAAAARVYDVVVQGKQLGGTERDGHLASGEFFNWPITSAISILRMQQGQAGAKGLEPANGYPDSIHVLAEALKELVPPDLIPDGVLDEPAPAGGRERSVEQPRAAVGGTRRG
ncbi:hypothetical protein SLS53_005600 [Cytospora paraplurivora]|uniref:Uncharacterized protein n=1 Tax=Cytospora paraplurivora TaxID=2898453 RepID=A0AAN9YFX7_9PEZI